MAIWAFSQFFDAHILYIQLINFNHLFHMEICFQVLGKLLQRSSCQMFPHASLLFNALIFLKSKA